MVRQQPLDLSTWPENQAIAGLERRQAAPRHDTWRDRLAAGSATAAGRNQHLAVAPCHWRRRNQTWKAHAVRDEKDSTGQAAARTADTITETSSSEDQMESITDGAGGPGLERPFAEYSCSAPHAPGREVRVDQLARFAADCACEGV